MNPNHWYPAAFSEEVRRGGIVATRFWSQDVAVYRADDGSVHAMEDRCAHRGIKLSHGSVEGCRLVCLYHGWSYDPDGRLAEMKHDRFGKKLPVVSVRSYPAQERYGIIWFYPGDPELARATPLVEIPHGDGRDAWASLHFAYTWRAHHSMVIDNLCNLTHLWVHGNWVPYGETVLADSTSEGDKLTLTWRHDLRRDWMHPISSRVFEKVPGSNESETFMIYDYPYQSALSNERIRSCNFMLPLDEKHTKVFTLQLWKEMPLPVVGRQLMRLGTKVLLPVTREIFRQDGFTVEEEQVAYDARPEAPIPEPNPAVKQFNELSVRKWDEHVSRGNGHAVTDAERREQRRVKRL